MRAEIIFYFSTIILFLVVLITPTYAQQIVKSKPFCTQVGNADKSKNPCNQVAGNLTFYCQGDTRWRNHPIGPRACDTLAAAGCGPTSIAMVLSAYGGTMTPDQLADLFTDQNEFVCGDNGGTAMEAILTNPSANSQNVRNILGLQVAPGGVLKGGKFDIALARQLLDPSSGYLIIGSSDHYPNCGFCGHIFVVQSVVDNNTVAIRDPNNCSNNGQENTNRINVNINSFVWKYAYAVKVSK